MVAHRGWRCGVPADRRRRWRGSVAPPALARQRCDRERRIADTAKLTRCCVCSQDNHASLFDDDAAAVSLETPQRETSQIYGAPGGTAAGRELIVRTNRFRACPAGRRQRALRQRSARSDGNWRVVAQRVGQHLRQRAAVGIKPVCTPTRSETAGTTCGFALPVARRAPLVRAFSPLPFLNCSK